MKDIILQSWFFMLLIIISIVMVELSPAETFSVDSGYIKVNGGNIFYEAAGEGPAIIMIQDGILNRETWDAQFTGFTGSHRVIRWDRRDYGRYAREPGQPAIGLLPEIKVPTLIIAGESDIPDVHAHIGVIQAGIVGSRREVLTHCGHLAHFEVPDVLNHVVRDFLETTR